MTFDLDAPPPPDAEVQLAPGVTVKVRPLTGAIACRADAEVASAFALLRNSGAAATRFRIDAGKLSDPAAFDGLFSLARAIVVAAHTITEWTVTSGGKPAPITEASIAHLFEQLPGAYYAFQEHTRETARRRGEAGELYAASRDTGSGAAASTAEGASSSTPPAAEGFPDPAGSTAPPPLTPQPTPTPWPSGEPLSATPDLSGTPSTTAW